LSRPGARRSFVQSALPGRIMSVRLPDRNIPGLFARIAGGGVADKAAAPAVRTASTIPAFVAARRDPGPGGCRWSRSRIAASRRVVQPPEPRYPGPRPVVSVVVPEPVAPSIEGRPDALDGAVGVFALHAAITRAAAHAASNTLAFMGSSAEAGVYGCRWLRRPRSSDKLDIVNESLGTKDRPKRDERSR